MDSFEKYVASYIGDSDNSKIIIFSCCNSYLFFHDLKTPIFEGVLNSNNYYNNYLFSHSLQSSDLKGCSNKKSEILSSPCHNSYLPPHNLKIPIFKKIPNYNNYYDNYIPFSNLQSPDSKSCLNKKSQIASLEDDLLARLSNTNL